MGIIGDKVSIRGAAIKAEKDLQLACLNLEDFKLVCNIYPKIKYSEILTSFGIFYINNFTVNDKISCLITNG